MSTAQQGFPPSSVTGSSNVSIKELALLATTETPFTLTAVNLNQLFIKSRTKKTELKYSFVMGDIALGNYWTIPWGCTEALTDINFSGKILYVEASNNCTIEIMQIFS